MAGINKGDSPVNQITVGNKDVYEVYKGNTLIWTGGDTQYIDSLWDDVLFLMPCETSSATSPFGTVKQPTLSPQPDTITPSFNVGPTNNNSYGDVFIDGYNGIKLGKNLNISNSAAAARMSLTRGTTESPYFPASTPFTIEFWLYYYGSSPVQGGRQFRFAFPVTSGGSYLGSGVNDYRILASAPEGATVRSVFSLGQNADGGASGISPETVVGEWQHHAIVRDTNNVIKYYINGNEPDASVTDSGQMGSNSAGTPLTFGGVGAYPYYGCRAIFRQIRFTAAARYTSDFTPFQRFYYPGII